MKDYTKYSFRITFLVIAIMLVVSHIPPFSVGDVNLRRTNILSEIVTFDDSTARREAGLGEADLAFMEEADRLEAAGAAGGAVDSTAMQTWNLGGEEADGAAIAQAGETVAASVRFEDYTPYGAFAMADVSRTLEQASGGRVVRVAFLGDSYIEGDIITGDVRAQLQELYGGQGVGFVPMGNPLAISRPTVAHKFGGWTNYNLINKKRAPEELQGSFFISGTVSVPGQTGAWSEYRGTGFRKRLASWSRARIIFADTAEGTTVDVAVNDSIVRQFTPEAVDGVQQIVLAGAGMRSLRVGVGAAAGFTGYGVMLDGTRGVAVDNYAIRSNSGLAIFGTDARVNASIGRMLGYDLIVLQWGLNAMDPEATNYKAYGVQLRRVIDYVKMCFPRSAVVVMGVGDRAVQREGVFVTAPAVDAMIGEQRAAARDCGVAFWDTFAAMGGRGSMASFVDKGWAAKDYTHLSYPGGKYIATRFVAALVDAKNDRGASGQGSYGGQAHEVEQLDLTRATGNDTLNVGGRDSVGVGVRDSVGVETAGDSLEIMETDSVRHE